MAFPAEQLAELKALCAGAKECEEGGIAYIFLPNLALPEGCAPTTVDALLRPDPRDGYNSRLFFAQEITPLKQITTDALNWNAKSVSIFERTWHAYSWRTPANLTLAQMVAIHLKALR